jgi:hypothetical protein
MMQPADHREGDDVPPIVGFALTRFGGILIERDIGGHLDAENQDCDHDGEYAVAEGDHPFEWKESWEGFH